ncbi:hypothetical protein H311_01060 [Anncaliia algerae PRA109]|nr:hypothetical protein H311_01060 [Anncaliia algerae PRA109]
MKKFYQFYLIFCILEVVEMLGAVIYIRKTVRTIRELGIYANSIFISTSVGYLLGNFFTFTSLSYAVLGQNYIALLFYFYFSCTIILTSLCFLPFSYLPYLPLIYIFPQIFEVIFVFYNSNVYSRKILFLRNRRIGSDLQLKKVLNVSKKII